MSFLDPKPLTPAALDSAAAALAGNPASALAGELSATYASKAEVNARDFGLMGDGTDETVKFQAFVDHLTANKKLGILPASEYRISAPINFAGTEGWGIRGMGQAATTILQLTDNTPIFRIGTGATETPNTAGCRMWSITDMTLRYQNNQATTNTAANCIYFEAMCYQFEMRRLFFYNGFYGWKVKPTQVVPWGFTADDLYFNKHITGGAIDWTGVINNGPNLNFGRIFVEANAMVGPIFILRGHNAVIQAVEIIWALLGPKLFEFAATSRYTIGALKLERATYTAAQVMIDVLTQAHVEFGQLRVRSEFNNIAPASGEVYLARVGAGGDSAYLKVGMLEAGDGTNTNAYVFDGGRNNQISVDNAQIISGWKLTRPSTKQTAEMVTVQKWANGRISEVKGDADLTVALGDPQTIYFGTALTAPRTVTLPSDAEMLTGGLAYEVIANGAVNGTNKLTIMSGTRTIIDITTDSRRVKLVWQRNANGANGWVVTSAGPRVS